MNNANARALLTLLFMTVLCTPLAASTTVVRVATSDFGKIKSTLDLERFLNANRGRSTPLDALDAASRNRFLESLRFTPAGLGSFSYVELEGATVTQAYQILGLFGAQDLTHSLPGLQIRSRGDWVIAHDLGAKPQDVIFDYACLKAPQGYACYPEQNSSCFAACYTLK